MNRDEGISDMQKYILALAAITLLTTPAIAGSDPICYPPVEVQAETVSKQIAEKIIDKYCDEPDPVSTTSGAIILYYDRDASGRCIAKVKVVK